MPSATEPLRHEVRIAAPPEVVFPYLTDPARMTSAGNFPWRMATTAVPFPAGTSSLLSPSPMSLGVNNA